MSYKKRDARRAEPPRNLRDLVIKLYPGKETAQELQTFGWWAKAVPMRVRKNASPVAIRGKTLIVNVSTSAWAQELQFMKEDLLERLRGAYPKSPIRELVFRVGRLPALKEPALVKAPPKVRPADLTEDVARELARVRDDDLRGAVASAAALSLARAEKDS